MATPAEVAQNAAYEGSAPLGNSGGGVVSVDTKPLENLAFYTMSYNKVKYDQQQKDTDQKIKELADLSDISLNDLRGKDKEQATKEFSVLLGQAADYARKTPKTQQEKIQAELDWQAQYGAFKNNFGSGKTRAVAYYKQLNDINATVSDATQKENQIKALNDKFDSTDIGTPISAMADFKIDTINIPKPNTQTFDTVGVDGNRDVVTTATIFNPSANLPLADAAVLGVKKTYKKGTPEYEGLSDLEQQQVDANNAVESTGKLWVDMAEPLNQILGNYKDSEGNFHEDEFLEDNASNTTVLNAYNALKNLSNYSETKKQQVASGIFNDKGLSFKLPPSIKPTDFNAGIINFSKGVTPNQLVLAAMYAQHTGDKFEKKVLETDNAIQKEDNALGWAKLKLDKDEFAAKQKQFELSQKGSQPQINGATERSKRIYAGLLQLTNADGIITPDKVRQLNVEQLKYLGTEVPDERDETTGVVTVKGEFKPLDLSSDKEYAIQLKNGNIQVLAPKEGDKRLKKLNSGQYVGVFDNKKSTNIFNIATNVLNEELIKAGSKELNSYWGVDVTGNPTKFTNEQSTQITTNSNTINPNISDNKLTDAQYFLKYKKSRK
jgi:hypothetical protein